MDRRIKDREAWDLMNFSSKNARSFSCPGSPQERRAASASVEHTDRRPQIAFVERFNRHALGYVTPVLRLAPGASREAPPEDGRERSAKR